ncbi:MAG: tripartite tricarboxylate transporter TctB family protein [Tagaea sp.]|nr:tripartite tricarboxylate transporter TctB family protein [Tagaea sp.]
MRFKLTAETFVGLAVLAFAAIVYFGAAGIPASPLYARIGPAVFPYAIAACMAVMGALLTFQGLAGGWSDEDPDTKLPVDFRALMWLAIGLAINLVAIRDLGFTLASALMFACIARCFGSERPAADFGVGFALAAAAYLGFSKALGINIGEGLLESLVF